MQSFTSNTLSPGTVNEVLLVEAMLRYEASLAKAQAAAGLVPEAVALSIVGTCKVELFDVPKIIRESRKAGDIAAAVVLNLRETVGIFNPAACDAVHLYTTNEEVLQSALATIASAALREISTDLGTTLQLLLELAQRHALDVLVDRVQLKPLAVTSLGLKYLQWAAPLARSVGALRERADGALQVRWGGAPEARAISNDHGDLILDLMAQDLGLAMASKASIAPLEAWLALGSELGILTLALGRMAGDLVCMAQTEVAELVEPTDEAQTTRRATPVSVYVDACREVMAAAQRSPQRIAALMADSAYAHGATPWHVEWGPWLELLESTQFCVAAIKASLKELRPETQRMRAHAEALLKASRVSKGQGLLGMDSAESVAALVKAQMEKLRISALTTGG